MRIAVNASLLDARPSGLGVYTHRIVKAMTKLAPTLDWQVFSSRPSAWGEASGRIRCIPAATGPSRGMRGHALRVLWTQTLLPWECARDSAAVLFCTGPEGPLTGSVPMVAVAHDLIPLLFPKLYPRQQAYFRHFVPAVLSRARSIIAVSERTKEDLVAHYGLAPERINVVYNGYAAEHFWPRPPADLSRWGLEWQHFFLYVGNYLPTKNLPNLIRAYAKVECDYPLVLVGHKDSRYYPAIARLAEELNIHSRVRYLDYVDYAELPTLYSGATAFVYPSIYEGFGLPPLEAMACGTSVVALNVGSLPEVVGDAGLLIEPDDLDALSVAMARFATDRGLRKELSQRGIDRATSFSWEKAARETLEVVVEAAHL